MKNNSLIFEGKDVEIFELNGQVLFNPKHVAEILGIADVKSSTRSFSDKQLVKIRNSDVHNMHFRKLNNAGENFLTESGVYKLIFKSRKPEAERFSNWVTDEVLPTIRKHGAYMTNEVIEKTLTDPDYLIRLATALKEERQARLLAEQKIEEQKPLVDFANQVADTDDLIDMGKMAKLLADEHINIGRNRLFTWLRGKKILMFNNVPYQRYIDGGYFQVKESTYKTHNDVKIRQTTFVTGKGQVWLVQKLKKEWQFI